jgi:hypothetical protein
MSEVNWNLGLQNGNAGDAFAQAFQQGQQLKQQNMAKAAMAALVADPNNVKALQALASVDPQAAQQFQAQKAQMWLQQNAHHQENILKGAEIIRQLQPKDDASWQQAKAVAAQAGVDVSEVPDHFDPNYVQGIVAIADAWKPQTQSDTQLVPYQQGGGVLRVNKQTGQVEQLVVPNDGTQAPGSPVNAGPQPGHIEDGYQFKGGNPADPNSWVKVGGATVSAPSRGFP